MRVARQSVDGRSLELYRVIPGELCLVSSASLIDAVAFQKLDQRLAATLLGRGLDLSLTHQALADEQGTAREIITRLLRRFEREGWLQLSRKHIHNVNSPALRAVASGAV